LLLVVLAALNACQSTSTKKANKENLAHKDSASCCTTNMPSRFGETAGNQPGISADSNVKTSLEDMVYIPGEHIQWEAIRFGDVPMNFHAIRLKFRLFTWTNTKLPTLNFAHL
jgi:hypothetical protein